METKITPTTPKTNMRYKLSWYIVKSLNEYYTSIFYVLSFNTVPKIKLRCHDIIEYEK